MDRINDAYAPSTMNNFQRQVINFVQFCDTHGLPVVPPHPRNVGLYLCQAADKNMVYGTIANKLSALVKMYKLCGLTLDVSDPALELFMKACKRQLSSKSKPKAPLEPGHIILISQTCDQSDRDFFMWSLSHSSLHRSESVIYFLLLPEPFHPSGTCLVEIFISLPGQLL